MDNQKETEQAQTIIAMADCMDMVRRELVEAGVIGEDVAPMFVADAVLARLAQGHQETLGLHRQLAAEKLRADRAEARADAKSQECIELRERMAARPPIPSTPEEAIAFIGNQFEVREDAEDLDRVRFQLTVHDLLSAFRWWFDDDGQGNSSEFEGISKSVTVTEKGPWQVNDWGQGRIVIQSDDFTHDVALEISGDFGSVERERAHAEEIARRLNAYPTLVYTCIGKGGEYELIGQARGAGTMRDHADLVVYRDAQTGQLYCRDRPDFVERMALVGSQR